MIHVSAFAGIGGFDLAFGETSVWIEIDPDCQKLLRQRFVGVPGIGDIKEAKGVGRVDVLSGGFPCQDVSTAGPRRGFEGDRSRLFWEYVRLIDETGPTWIVIENVEGLLSSNRGRDMGAVLGSLVDRGYSIAYRVLDAQFFGIPQRRRRVFVVGHCATDRNRAAEVLSVGEGVPGNPDPLPAPRPRTAGTVPLGARIDAAFNLMPESGQGADLRAVEATVSPAITVTDHAKMTDRGIRIVQNGIVRRITPLECERLQGFPDGWTDGFPDVVRFRMLGNAVPVPVARWIGDRIRAKERQTVG